MRGEKDKEKSMDCSIVLGTHVWSILPTSIFTPTTSILFHLLYIPFIPFYAHISPTTFTHLNHQQHFRYLWNIVFLCSLSLAVFHSSLFSSSHITAQLSLLPFIYFPLYILSADQLLPLGILKASGCLNKKHLETFSSLLFLLIVHKFWLSYRNVGSTPIAG